MGHDQQVRRGVEDVRRRITHTPLVRDRERDPGWERHLVSVFLEVLDTLLNESDEDRAAMLS